MELHINYALYYVKTAFITPSQCFYIKESKVSIFKTGKYQTTKKLILILKA